MDCGNKNAKDEVACLSKGMSKSKCFVEIGLLVLAEHI